ncbi:MAG TPA: PQQ-binding-like beta-propeller repeat protein [Ktedonobacterales bacterium]
MSPRRLRTVGLVLSASVVLVACVFGFVATRPRHTTAPLNLASPTATVPPTPSPTPGLPGNDWTQYRYDIAGTGDNPEDLISTADAPGLATRWLVGAMFSGHAFESSPAVYHGTVYITNGNSLFAFDLRTGKYRWQFDVAPPTNLPQISSSVAIDPSTDIAYFGTPDARVLAVSLTTHQQVWQVTLGAASQGAYIWSSPLLVNGLVYFGLASHNDHPCVRGAAFALDPATGHTVWVHYVVTPDRLGGGVWSSMTADPDEDAILVTTGNPCDGPEDVPVEGGATRADENAVLALNWNTGATLWRYTAISTDFGEDLDFGEGAVVFSVSGQKYVVAGNKQGTVYALNPPAAAGGAPHLAWSQTLSTSGAFPNGGIFTPPTYHNGVIYEAGGPTPDGVCQQGALFALNAASGAVLWRQCTAGQVVSPPSYTGGVLFVGQHMSVVAYNAATGKVLWQGAINGDVYGGVTVSHGIVLLGTVTGASRLYAFALPVTT